jgi:hypothetical protein
MGTEGTTTAVASGGNGATEETLGATLLFTTRFLAFAGLQEDILELKTIIDHI